MTEYSRQEITNTSEETLELIITRVTLWQIKKPDRLEIEMLKSLLGLLYSQLQPREGSRLPDRKRETENPICSAPNCRAGWKEGLINQALPGFDPVWYCRKHEPDYKANGISSPPGTLPDRRILLAKAKEFSGLWNRFLARLEREAISP